MQQDYHKYVLWAGGDTCMAGLVCRTNTISLMAETGYKPCHKNSDYCSMAIVPKWETAQYSRVALLSDSALLIQTQYQVLGISNVWLYANSPRYVSAPYQTPVLSLVSFSVAHAQNKAGSHRWPLYLPIPAPLYCVGSSHYVTMMTPCVSSFYINIINGGKVKLWKQNILV